MFPVPATSSSALCAVQTTATNFCLSSWWHPPYNWYFLCKVSLLQSCEIAQICGSLTCVGFAWEEYIIIRFGSTAVLWVHNLSFSLLYWYCMSTWDPELHILFFIFQRLVTHCHIISHAFSTPHHHPLDYQALWLHLDLVYRVLIEFLWCVVMPKIFVLLVTIGGSVPTLAMESAVGRSVVRSVWFLTCECDCMVPLQRILFSWRLLMCVGM